MFKTFLLTVALCGACTTTDEPAPTTKAAVAHSTASDWRVRMREDIAALERTDRALLAELRTLQPEPTRAQFLRFTAESLHDPRAASVLIERLAAGTESEAVRSAIVDALPRTGGLYGDAAADLVVNEMSSSVRAAYVYAARRAPAEAARAILVRGFADASPEVRASAVRSAGARADGAQFASELTAAAADPALRSDAARALRVLKIR